MKGADRFLLFLILLVVIFGSMMVFSASYYSSITSESNKLELFFKTVQFAGLGLFLMLVLSYIPYKMYANRTVSLLLLLLSVLLLLYLLINRDSVREVNRWIRIGGGISFQPVEAVKLFSVIIAAWFLSSRNVNEKRTILTYFGVVGGITLLIAVQPSLSSAVTFLLIPVSIYFFAGLKTRYVLGAGAVFGVLLAIFVTLNPYMLDRLKGVFNPFEDILDKGWQVSQSLYALGRGRITGVGFGLSTQNKLYIPEAPNDFILGTIGEELGLFGTIGLLAVYTMMIGRCVQISLHAPDRKAKLLASGVTVWFTLQVIFNYGVSLALLPPTGVALPLVSYGGTSLLFLLLSFGMILNISRYSETEV